LVPDDDCSSSFFDKENFFRIVMFVKRDSLPRCHGGGKNEKILRVTVLAIELDGEWPASSRTSAAHKVFTVIFLQNLWMGWSRALRSLGG
jgi:hypothetical protein